MGSNCVFVPSLYQNKEASLGFSANATEDPLPFDGATSVILDLAKLGLINLNSFAKFTYRPRMMIYDSVGTNLPKSNASHLPTAVMCIWTK